jgi:hypothetical protein
MDGRVARASRTPNPWLRAVLFAAVAVLGLYVAYLVAINVFLSTSLFGRAINGKPLTIDIHYRRGWSVWPGVIHARDLSIRSRDGNVELMLRIDQVRFNVNFLGLAHRRFEASHVRGKGVSFRLRQRIDWMDLSPERLAGLPPIEGVWAVPVRPFRTCSLAEWSDAPADYYLWTIHLEDVQAEDTREIWIDKNLFEGPMAVGGRFYLKPLRAVEVGPISTELHGVRLVNVGATWLEGLDETGRLEVRRFDPRRDVPLAHMKLQSDLRGVAPDIGRFPLPLPEGMRLDGPVDLRRVALRLEDGAIRSGSKVELASPRLSLQRGDDRGNAALAVTGEVGKEERATVRALASDARVSRGDVQVASIPRLDAAADMERLLLDGPVKGAHLAIEAREIDVPDARALAAYLPSQGSLAIEGGRARADVGGQAWIDAGRAEGRASMQAEDVDLRSGKTRVRAGVTAAANVKSYEWRDGRLSLESEAQVGAHVVAPGKEPDTGFTGDLHGVLEAKSEDGGTSLDLSGTAVRLLNVSVDGEAAPQSSGDLLLQNATLQLSPPDLRGVLSANVVEATPFIQPRVPALFRKLADVPRAQGSARLTVKEGRARIDDIDVRGGSLAARGLFGARGSRRLGAFIVNAGQWTMGVRVDTEGAHVRLFGLDGWLDEEKARVGRQIGP